VTQCSVVIGYQHFGGLCRLNLHGEEGGVTWYPILTLQSVTSQKTPSSIPVTKLNVLIYVSVMSIGRITYTERQQERMDHRLGKYLLCSEPVTYLIICMYSNCSSDYRTLYTTKEEQNGPQLWTSPSNLTNVLVYLLRI
jgi:hypothetical protein